MPKGPRGALGELEREKAELNACLERIAALPAGSPAPSDKYIVTRSVEWFEGVHSRFRVWLYDEEVNNRLLIIVSFGLGALITRLAPEVWWYAQVVAGMLIVTALAIGFLLPVAYLVEWVCRRWFIKKNVP